MQLIEFALVMKRWLEMNSIILRLRLVIDQQHVVQKFNEEHIARLKCIIHSTTQNSKLLRRVILAPMNLETLYVYFNHLST